MQTRSCLIVGAGIAGLTAADTLRSAGWAVTVVDKGRSVGGRMATRRIDSSSFDHGAQFFTARDERFKARVHAWEAAGIAQNWHTSPAGEPRYRGVEGMSSIPKHLALGLDVHTSTRIAHIEPADNGWAAEDQSGNRFAAAFLILTPPPEQSLALCEPFRPLLGRRLVQSLQGIHFDPCYALMLLLDEPLQLAPPGLEKLDDTDLLTISDNVQKGISEGPGALTLHASSRFTIEHWDDEPGVVAKLLQESAARFIKAPVRKWELHRWRYSHPVRGDESRFLSARCPAPLYFAGDAFGGPRVEGAYLSGLEAAEHLIASCDSL
ncbi:MAG: FAD-dependent oxidoreductase [Bryobacteraceae bacterium]|nr:FAD-dependent oxidoreductase [Bryobacteraceae bacterium]